MKKLIIACLFACGLTVPAMAQTEFEHAQTRVQEAMSEFFVRPMVAELQMIKNVCQEYGPFTIYPGTSLGDISVDMLSNAKANAAYKASRVADADIILGATFYVTNGKTKNKGLDVIVRGYPAKYVNFHSFGDVVKGKDDSKWIVPLQDGARIRGLLSTDQKQTKAIENKTR